MRWLKILTLALLLTLPLQAGDFGPLPTRKANKIKITDSGGYYNGTEVETALQEIGNGTALGDVYVNESGDTMTGNLTSQFIFPSDTNTSDLGSSSKKWKDVYVNGTVYYGALDPAVNVTETQDLDDVCDLGATTDQAITISKTTTQLILEHPGVPESSTLFCNSQGDLELNTTGGDVRIGSIQLWLYDADGDSPSLAIESQDLSTTTFQEFNTTGVMQIYNDAGEFRFMADGDQDDYVAVNTTTNQTTINFVGQDGKYTADGGDHNFDDDNITTTGTITVGVGAGLLNADANDNMIFGVGAGSSLGAGALQNVAIGKDALLDCVSGDYNIAIGRNALHETTGLSNVGIGESAGHQITGNYNFAIGYHTLWYCSTGDYNTAIGIQAEQYNKTGNQNTAVGGYAGRGVYNNSRTGNTCVGYAAGFGISTGNRNTCIGLNAGNAITTGGENIVIGQSYGMITATANNQLSIGNVLFSDGVGTAATMGTGHCGVKVFPPLTDWHVNGATACGTLTQTAAGPTDNLDVSADNTVWIDTSSNSVTIGGFTGGIDGQWLFVVVKDATNNAVLEHSEGTGNQDIFLDSGADETLTASYGGWTLVCDGSNWFEVDN